MAECKKKLQAKKDKIREQTKIIAQLMQNTKPNIVPPLKINTARTSVSLIPIIDYI